MYRTIVVAFLLTATAACSKAKSTSNEGPLTKQRLDEAMKRVGDAFPAPFDETYKKVVADLGPPKKSDANLFQWYAGSDGACWELFLTKGKPEGAAAANVSKVEAALCAK